MQDHLILTVDYEVFGDGSGCLERCVVDPADTMLECADRFGARITFFVEVLGLMALEHKKNNIALAELAKVQLRRALRDGHDAQLHIHPQWSDNGKALRDLAEPMLSRWRIADLERAEIQGLIATTKTWLETVLCETEPRHRCIAFRAGGWCIQPSRDVVNALREHDFLIDSTVAPGLVNYAAGDWYDFRDSPSAPYWSVEADVCVDAGRGVIEVPIVVGPVSRSNRLRRVALRRRSQDAAFAPGCRGSYGGPNGLLQRMRGTLGKLAGIGHAMLDLSTMSAAQMVALVQAWRERYSSRSPLPIVAIAHTKNFSVESRTQFLTFLEWASGRPDLVFSTFPRWLQASGALDSRP